MDMYIDDDDDDYGYEIICESPFEIERVSI
jgi:hypothetical protein